jgi:hypothetical protein
LDLNFRKVAKAPLRISIPVDLEPAITIAAKRSRQNRQEFLTRIICEKLRIDPARFGLTPRPSKRAKATVDA